MKPKKLSVTVENIQLLDSIPSGSGLAVVGDAVFIVGDDATAVFRMGPGAQLLRIQLPGVDSLPARISKPAKHDLESLTPVTLHERHYLLAFGSGSVSPQREQLLVIDPQDLQQTKWLPLGGLYKQLRRQSKAKELNIEGAVVVNDVLYLFNRSANEIFGLPMSEINQFFLAGGDYIFAAISVYGLELPATSGARTGLSGACVLQKNLVLFSASAENTDNAYDDGEVYGSFIGLADPTNRFRVLHFVALKDKNGVTMKDKLESLDLLGTYENGDLKVVAVADNDDGRSKLLELRIRLK